MEAKPDRVYGKKTVDPGTRAKEQPVKKAVAIAKEQPVKKAVTIATNPLDLSDAPKAPFPKTVSPMLATLVDEPVDGPGWLYEIKWDGYRAIALCNKNKLELISRNNKSFNEKFYAVYDAVKALGLQAVLDGEIAVLNSAGVSRFGALQNWRSEADGDLVYYVFDLLWLNGHDLQEWPLTRRRALLQSILPEEGSVRLSETFDTSATEFLEAAGKMGLEGIIAKRADSQYHQGDRGGDWLKIKVHKRHEVVIGGFTRNDDSPKAFSALLVGVYDGQRLHYTGKIGTGFSDKVQKEMMAKFKPLITDKLPFMELPDVNKPSRFRPNPPHASATWLKPKLVCEVSYSEVTEDGVMRHPSFEGMRIDKNAKDVHAEVEKHTEAVIAGKAGSKRKSKAAPKTAHQTPPTQKSLPRKNLPLKSLPRKNLPLKSLPQKSLL